MPAFSDKHFKFAARLFIWFALFTFTLFPGLSSAQDAVQEISAPPAAAAQPEPAFVLQSFYLSGNENMLTARLAVGINNLDYLRDILRDGARLVIECRSALYRKRLLWPNALIAEYNFSSSLKYNPLQRDYLIFSEGRPSISKQNLEELLQATWGNLEMPLAELSTLEKGETYVAVVSLALRHEEMPPWLSKNVFFWSGVIIPKQEYTLEFDY